ncbi:23S rRNA (adenine(2503)-C(2))-methyltransferase RlmN [Anaerostipes sp.]|uniref:23S rRNA (adenine(2503)-C(2))-methyltransferase RlmN n=1 Tax=Anaerostipes sp. TaxID=1872530 RepID=UPI0025C6ED91|nr:23S rRNA (adenine(2503)-C(2))-methyltransferase RlmN [Anaerostipes sp.]MBS7007842.1 23S rRNA (adenine(2503)-C(2))-methyltransferase RlmN [Anaerostipes sp.]
MKDLKSMTLGELELAVEQAGEKKFRAKQIFEWFHKRLASSLDEMNNLPKVLKEKLLEEYEVRELQAVETYVSKIDGTRKYLFQLNDGNIIESVLMKYKHGNSVCISSQAGCRMGCKFCASTLGGLDRNLLPSEMLGQIYYIQKETGERVSNVVVMGTGEPLDNYENLLTFIRLLTDEKGLNLSQRNLTVSTCGLVPKIRELAGEKLQMTLAISLHASNDDMRKSLMPVANQYSIEELLSACKYYFQQTGRRITFEYSLVAGVNDSPQNAEELCRCLEGFACHVNLIPVNPIKERDFRQSMPEFVNDFKNILEKNRVNVTIRREMGRDINAACGQLRRKKLDSVDKHEIRMKKEN